MAITKTPISNKAADALTKTQSNKNPKGILKKTKIMGKVKNVPAKTTMSPSAVSMMKKDSVTYGRQNNQKQTGLY
jgi:hypothetical protein